MVSIGMDVDNPEFVESVLSVFLERDTAADLGLCNAEAYTVSVHIVGLGKLVI